MTCLALADRPAPDLQQLGQPTDPTSRRRWNEMSPHLLARATREARRAAPHLTHLADFIVPRIPRRPLASDTLHTPHPSSSEALIEDAISMPWIAFNNTTFTNALTVDCDHTEAEDQVDAFMPYLREIDPAAPAPMIVRDPFSARAHVTWFLERPIFTGPQAIQTAARSAPVLRTLGAVLRGLMAALDGDPAFTNRLTKNPFGIGQCLPKAEAPVHPPLWDAHVESGTELRFHTIPGDCRPIGLLTLWRALKAWTDDTGRKIPWRRRRPDANDGEKGARLFNAARFAVYDAGTSDLATILAIVDDKAALLGSAAPPMAREKIARSIAGFMRTRWTGARGPGCHRGVMELDAASLDLPERQALGGKHGARMNAADTDKRIASAVGRLQAAGKRLTQIAIANEAGISERTVRSRWRKPAIQSLSGIMISGGEQATSQGQQPPPSLAAQPASDRGIRRTVRKIAATAIAEQPAFAGAALTGTATARATAAGELTTSPRPEPPEPRPAPRKSAPSVLPAPVAMSVRDAAQVAPVAAIVPAPVMPALRTAKMILFLRAPSSGDRLLFRAAKPTRTIPANAAGSRPPTGQGRWALAA